MTTYSYDGMSLSALNVDDMSSGQSILWWMSAGLSDSHATLELVLPYAQSTFSYSYVNDTSHQVIAQSDALDIRVNGTSIDPSEWTFSLFHVFSSGTTDAETGVQGPIRSVGGGGPYFGHYFLTVENASEAYVFEFFGLPIYDSDLSSWGAFRNFLAGTEYTGRLDGDEALTRFAPNSIFTLGDTAGRNVPDELLEGTDASDYIDGAEGNDTIFGFLGEDTIEGGSGDDIIDPGNAVAGRYQTKIIDPGSGDDIVDFSGITNNYAYSQVFHDDLSSGFSAVVNASTGLFNKPFGETTTLIDADIAMQSDGLGLHGTQFADTFDVTPVDGGFLSVEMNEGNDTINIGAHNGTLRLDYRDVTVTSGAEVNLETGVVANDGFGFQDSIGGSQQVSWLRGTILTDIMIGSDRDELFFPTEGNDTVDGKGGIDGVRYDRNGVSSVVVDLEAGTATLSGAGAGQVQTLLNIENLRGSRSDDTLLGNEENNGLNGRHGDDFISGRGGDDTLLGYSGDDTLIGGDGQDTLLVGDARAATTLTNLVFGLELLSGAGRDVVYADVETISFSDQDILFSTLGSETLSDDSYTGTSEDELLFGFGGNDTISAGDGNDTLNGGDGVDTLIGGTGDDFIFGGSTSADLRDIVYAGDGHDSVDGGYGNDELRGDAGNDTIEGGFGVDVVIGGDGDDVLTGSAWSDEIFGGNDNDFINGGFGFDRVNGGSGADRFFHIGIADHGSDWIQDYNAAEGDVLLYGGGVGPATVSDFLVQRANTPNAGDAAISEVFVTHIPSGNLLWALVDGDAQTELMIRLGGVDYDLLA